MLFFKTWYTFIRCIPLFLTNQFVPIVTFTTSHLFIITLALIAGISFTSSIFWAAAIFAIALLAIYHQAQRSMLIALACCFFFVGSTRYYQNKAAYFEYSNLLEKNCNISCTVQEILPRLDEQEQICLLLHVSDVEIYNEHHTINKRIYLYLPFYAKVWVQPFQKILVKNIILKHPRSASYQEYLIREGVWAVAHQTWLSYSTIKKPALWQQQINELYSLPLHTTNHKLSQLTQSLYVSIFCGKKIKSETTTKMKELFQYWGISHHLARSGLHLVILIGILLFLLSCVPCSAFKKQWAIVAMLCLYYLMTYPSVAFMRAFYMYLLYTLCKQLYIPSSPTHILLITTLLILIANPHHLFFLDFQLSFGITFLILWFCQVTQNSKTIAS